MKESRWLVSLGKAFAAGAFLALMTASAITAFGAEEKLIAPIYPGSLRVSPAKMADKMASVVFLTKDPHDKVQAFYVPKYSRLPKEREGSVYDQDDKLALIAMDAKQTRVILETLTGNSDLAQNVEVLLEWTAPALQGMGVSNQALAGLKQAAKKNPAHAAELADLEKKYAWLDLAFYPEGKASEIISRYQKEAAGGTGADATAFMALAEKAEKLRQQGKEAEAQALLIQAAQGMSAGGKKVQTDTFAVWKKCLEELAANGYLTKISIETHPSQWPR